MLKTTVEDILKATGGTLLAGDERQFVTAVETDSRLCGPGMLFVPLTAARDGHDFLGAALAAGAEGALCSKTPENFAPGKFYVAVADTRLALKALASWYRAKFSIPFVQITGSVGKTTTKEMIGAVLSEHYNTLRTEGNFNNDIGVPKTLFRLMPEHEAAVIETGMNRLSAAEREAFFAGVPLGRAGTPEETAAAVRFLAESRYVTGEVLRMNGGMHM